MKKFMYFALALMPILTSCQNSQFEKASVKINVPDVEEGDVITCTLNGAIMPKLVAMDFLKNLLTKSSYYYDTFQYNCGIEYNEGLGVEYNEGCGDDNNYLLYFKWVGNKDISIVFPDNESRMYHEYKKIGKYFFYILSSYVEYKDNEPIIEVRNQKKGVTVCGVYNDDEVNADLLYLIGRLVS